LIFILHLIKETYLNKGGNKFDDISIKPEVEGQSDWNAGTVMADVNGYLDIYVCVVGNQWV
jgi:hypothetical protein